MTTTDHMQLQDPILNGADVFPMFQVRRTAMLVLLKEGSWKVNKMQCPVFLWSVRQLGNGTYHFSSPEGNLFLQKPNRAYTVMLLSLQMPVQSRRVYFPHTRLQTAKSTGPQHN